MRQTVDAPNGLRWTVKRLIVPTGMRPMTRTDMLDVASPRRTVVDGMSRQVPDAMGAWTGPLPLGHASRTAVGRSSERAGPDSPASNRRLAATLLNVPGHARRGLA